MELYIAAYCWVKYRMTNRPIGRLYHRLAILPHRLNGVQALLIGSPSLICDAILTLLYPIFHPGIQLPSDVDHLSRLSPHTCCSSRELSFRCPIHHPAHHCYYLLCRSDLDRRKLGHNPGYLKRSLVGPCYHDDCRVRRRPATVYSWMFGWNGVYRFWYCGHRTAVTDGIILAERHEAKAS